MKLEVCTETMTLSNSNSTNAQNSQRSKQRNENEKNDSITRTIIPNTVYVLKAGSWRIKNSNSRVDQCVDVLYNCDMRLNGRMGYVSSASASAYARGS